MIWQGQKVQNASVLWYIRARRFLYVFLVQRTHWFQPLARKKNKKNFKENAYLRISSRAQVLSSTVAEKETDCSTQTTVLWRLMEKVNLLVSKLFLAVHRSSKWIITIPPVSITWPVAFIGALEQLRDSSWWILGRLRGEIPKKFFVCDSFCGQNVDLDREGAGGPTIARSLSCARSFAMPVSARSLVYRERDSKLARKSGRRDLLKWMSFVCFFAALQDGGLLEMGCFSSMVSLMIQTLLDHHISHFLCEVLFVFWLFVYFFRAPALIFKKDWTRNIKNKRRALNKRVWTLFRRGVPSTLASESWSQSWCIQAKTDTETLFLLDDWPCAVKPVATKKSKWKSWCLLCLACLFLGMHSSQCSSTKGYL